MLAAAATSALLLGACAASAASDNGPRIDARPGTTESSRTVGVSPSHPSTTATTTTLPAEPVLTDNRVYLVGDSITESISSRYSGAVCDALNPLGWDVTVDAVVGRQTADAVQSLRAHLADVGQVMVVLIGHNDGIDPASYKAPARPAHRAGARRPPDLPAHELPVREGPGPDERRAPAGGGGGRRQVGRTTASSWSTGTPSCPG